MKNSFTWLLYGWGKRAANFVIAAYIIGAVYAVICAFFGFKYDENIFFGLLFWAIVFCIPIGIFSSVIINWRINSQQNKMRD
jgi:hypothetical protein